SSSYAPKHTPFVFFQDVAGNPPSGTNTSCSSHIVDYTQLGADLTSGNLADYIFIPPNLCNDMHDCSVATGDSWLKYDPTVQQIITYVTNPANHAILAII